MASAVTGLRGFYVEIVQPGRIQSTSEYPFTPFVCLLWLRSFGSEPFLLLLSQFSVQAPAKSFYYSAKCLTFIVTRISCRSNRQVKQLPTPLVLRLGCERQRHTWTASIYARVFFSAVCFCEMGGQFCLPCTLSTSVLCKYLV